MSKHKRKLLTAKKESPSLTRDVPPALLSAFEDESLKVQRLAFQKPDYWEHLLTIELLKPRLALLRRQFDNAVKLPSLAQRQRLSIPQLLANLPAKTARYREITGEAVFYVNEKLMDAWGAPGEPGDALKIKAAADGILACCRKCIAWEKELAATDAPEVCRRLLKAMSGTTKPLLDFFAEMVAAVENVYEQPQPTGPYEFDFNLKMPDNYARDTKAALSEIENYIIRFEREFVGVAAGGK